MFKKKSMRICAVCHYWRANSGECESLSVDGRCTHPKYRMKTAVDPVTGATGFKRWWTTRPARVPYPECRDMNKKGKCRRWRERLPTPTPSSGENKEPNGGS